MILNARNKKPKISFGLGATEISVNAGETVKVWLENIFSEKDFLFAISGVTAVKISSYEWEISDLEKGNNYTVQMDVTPIEKPKFQEDPGGKAPGPEPKPIILKSNPITLTVL